MRKPSLLFPFIVLLVVTGASCGGRGEQLPPLTAAEFQTLRWLDGRWQGSGGNYPSFFEEYRVLDDSTIQQYEIPDSTFANPTARGVIKLRAGAGTSGPDSAPNYRIARVAGDTVRFEPMVANRGGFTWIRTSDSTWRAILDGATPTVYEMQRPRALPR